MSDNGPADSDVEKLIAKAKEIYQKTREVEFHQLRSFEHMYRAFVDPEADNDYLALHIAVYMSNWGMMRSKSFLDQTDYQVHTGVVPILKSYMDLRDVTVDKIAKEPTVYDRIIALKNEIEQYYESINPVRQGREGSLKVNKASSTLTSKLILGTLGCVPPFDTGFSNAFRQYWGFLPTFDNTAIFKLTQFYLHNIDKFEEVRKTFIVPGTKDSIIYPQMKLLTMMLMKPEADY